MLALQGKVVCRHPDATAQITLLEATPPVALCRECYRVMREASDAYVAQLRSLELDERAYRMLGFDDDTVAMLLAEAC